MAQFYTRPATHNLNQFARIADAYTLAGLTAPTYVAELKRTINEAPTVDQVAATIATEALDATDAQEFYEDALKKIQRAHAADALKEAFNRNIQRVQDSKANHYRATAADDLTPAFNKITKALSTAAAKLPAHNPLDMAASIDAGTGAEYKTARDTLAQLGTYASIHHNLTPGQLPTVLAALLPILALPTAVIEHVKPNLGESVVTINTSAMGPTLSIRKLANDAALDLDTALVNVAAGRYEGITLDLATPSELNARRINATNAYTRKTVTNHGDNAMISI